jgi:hypothetical protein
MASFVKPEEASTGDKVIREMDVYLTESLEL